MNIEELFDQMSYGTSMESDAESKIWIETHQATFGPFISGKWLPDLAVAEVGIYSCGKAEKLVRIRCSPGDLSKAVVAANFAHENWSKTTSAFARSQLLLNLSGCVLCKAALLANLECMSTGRILNHVRNVLTARVARHFSYFAKCLGHLRQHNYWTSIGTVVICVPTTCSTLSVVEKVAPAVAAGNSVVLCLDGSRQNSAANLALLHLPELFIESGFPAGLVNLVYATEPLWKSIENCGPVAGLSYVGNLQEGREVRQKTAGSGVRLSLFLDYRLTVLIFENGDLASAVDAVVLSVREACEEGITLRILIQEGVFVRVVELLKARLANIRTGSGLDRNVDFGPLAMSAYAEIGKHFSGRSPNDPSQVRLSTFDLLAFRTAKEALELANDGFVDQRVSLWTENITLALEVIRVVKASTIWVNGSNEYDPSVEMGSVQLSGNGIRCGEKSMYQYMQPSWYQQEHRGWNQAEKLEAVEPSCLEKLLSMKKIIDAAHKNQAGWQRSVPDICAKLFATLTSVHKDKGNLAVTLSQVLGGSETDASVEVDAVVEQLYLWASSWSGSKTREHALTSRLCVVDLLEPLGVIAIIISSDCPIRVSASLIFSALVTGNAVVLLVDPKHTPFFQALNQKLVSGGLPSGVLSVIERHDDHLSSLFQQDVQAVWYFGFSPSDSTAIEYFSGSCHLQQSWCVNADDVARASPPGLSCEELLLRCCRNKVAWLSSGVTFAS